VPSASASRTRREVACGPIGIQPSGMDVS
jgi:hypothetical protein